MDLLEQEGLCSAAFKRGKYRQVVKVGRRTTLSVPFVVIPTRQGQHTVDVKAETKDSVLTDGIRKTLQVVVRERRRSRLSDVIHGAVPPVKLKTL